MMNPLDKIDPKELGERLRTARVRAGLRQADAAARLDLVRTTLVAIEKGQRRVKSHELRELVSLYGSSVNALLRPTAVHVDLTPRFRAMPEAAEATTVEAAQLLTDLAAAEVELERLLMRPLRPNYPAERSIFPGNVHEQAEEAALEQRHRLGLGLAPIPDIVSLLELEVGARVFIHPLPSKISGLFAYEDELGACILLNRNHPRERRALTAGHEWGHLVSTRRQPDVAYRDRPPQSREETFATSFGLALLMPAIAVRRRFQDIVQDAGRFSPRHLILMAHAFHVSPEAMCRRLEGLSLLPRGKWELLKERGFSGEVVRQVLGDRPRGNEFVIPPRLWMLAVEAFRHELLSEGQLVQMLKMDRVEVREMLDALEADENDAAEPLSPN